MEEKIYGGRFEINNKEYSGQIRFLEGKYLALELHISERILVHNELNLKDIVIYGTTVTGAKVTLINCSYRSMHSYVSHGKTIIIFMCQYLIWGQHVEKDLKCIYVTLENAVLWSGLSGIKQEHFVDDWFDVLKFKSGDKLQFDYKNFSIEMYTIYNDEFGSRPMPEKGEICERLVLKIEAKDKRDIFEYFKVVNDTLNIISFCMLNNVNILKIKCETEESYQLLPSGEKQFYTLDLIGISKKLSISQHDLKIDFVTLNQIKDEILQNFLNEYEEIKPIIELYTLLIKNPDIPSHIQYLNIIQALESFHSRFIFDDIKKYKAFIDSQYGLSDSYEFYKRFLLPEQQDGIDDFIVLTSRINHCFTKLDVSVFDYFKDGIISNKLTDTRHYFTHYSKTKLKKAFKNESLNKAITLLSVCLNYLIWQHFGLDRKNFLIEQLKWLDVEEMKKTD